MAEFAKAIKAKPMNVKAVRLELLNALRKVGKDIAKDFEATVKSWKKKPKFAQKISLQNGPSVEITTESEIYGYVDKGTPAHDIYPRKAKVLRFSEGYTAKTKPGVIGSGDGGPSGGVLFRPYVRHPGTEARKFTEAIQKKWRREFPKRMTEAMKRAQQKSGHEMK